ncbi:glycoside hydrolase family 25 protein [Emticicia sp. 17c]|uniref:glycoside hydrolase family 25 protein n=1 Tax=Emticicia sp. 17c TaxID=3127704 RepID=UPI00301D2252
MRKKKKNLTPPESFTKKLARRVFTLKSLYALVVISLIILYPVYVSDGQKWTYVSDFGIKVPLRYTIHGIDVSHHNKKIDWLKVKHSTDDDVDISFCFIKATEGTDLKDQDFQRNWKEAKHAGLTRGAYHFYVPWANPIAQAKNFIESVSLEEGDFVPVVDFEIQGANRKVREKLVANVNTFIEYLKSHYGVNPIIYTNRHIYHKYVKGNFDAYPLWISDYESRKLEGFENANLILWQHSTNGRLDGIGGDVDFNVFVASKNHFNDICVK